MPQNAYLLAKIGAHTAENEQHFAEICQKLATGSPASRQGCANASAAFGACARPPRGLFRLQRAVTLGSIDHVQP